MSISILLTSAGEDSEEIISWINQHEATLLHLPLEYYSSIDISTIDWEDPGAFENIVYGNKRNALFFLKEAKRRKVLEQVKKKVNLTLDKSTADFLEASGIPAISAFGESKPINLVEFMLRLRRTGSTLYPCGKHTREEIPGFLEELDIPVYELELYDLKGPNPEKLEEHREVLSRQKPDIVIFHSRSSVTRTLTAFPQLDFSTCVTVAGDVAVTQKLKEAGIPLSAEAEGSWGSIAEKVSEQF